ncbi:MAG: hypothetical protein AAF410_03380, partial [Pseudomonadota bacterium]
MEIPIRVDRSGDYSITIVGLNTDSNADSILVEIFSSDGPVSEVINPPITGKSEKGMVRLFYDC